MIVGVGVDLLEVERLARDLRKKDGLREEIFTADEIAYCQKKRYPAEHFAARFCAKEAFFKALGSGKRGAMGWREIEVQNDQNDRPQIELRGQVKAFAERIGAKNIHLSLSHTRKLAAAFVILES